MTLVDSEDLPLLLSLQLRRHQVPFRLWMDRKLKLSAMVGRLSNSAHIQGVTPTRTTIISTAFLHRLQEYASINSMQLVGLMTFMITGAILLLLARNTITAIVLSLIFFTPLIIIMSSIWVPTSTFSSLLTQGSCACADLAVGMSWMYPYFRELNPVGSGRIDYARAESMTQRAM